MPTFAATGVERVDNLEAHRIPSEMGGTLKIAILQGDPMTAGRSFTVRLSGTDGTKIVPHWHPTTENVTVIKGAFLLGMGAKWDAAATKEIPVGGFVPTQSPLHCTSCRICGGSAQ